MAKTALNTLWLAPKQTTLVQTGSYLQFAFELFLADILGPVGPLCCSMLYLLLHINVFYVCSRNRKSFVSNIRWSYIKQVFRLNVPLTNFMSNSLNFHVFLSHFLLKCTLFSLFPFPTISFKSTLLIATAWPLYMPKAGNSLKMIPKIKRG